MPDTTFQLSPDTQLRHEAFNQDRGYPHNDPTQVWPGQRTQNEFRSELMSRDPSTESVEYYPTGTGGELLQQTGAITSPASQPVQRIRSLDLIEGSITQFYGMSSESDPWLLRHCRYDEYGMHGLHRTRIRNVGGVPIEGLVPVHFLETEKELMLPKGSEMDNRPQKDQMQDQNQLDVMVSPAHGKRLLCLFLRFVFPAIPIISRSQLGISSSMSTAALEKIPVHLLAAIYASAIPFAVHDPVLCVSAAYGELLSGKLWQMVHELILQETHTPKLAVLQASLLYLQQIPAGSLKALPDGPFIWSFLGSTVALAVSLGLHVEPRPWGIPPWEKRLRRRLWWAVYVEDKWRSLLAGRPSFIHPDENDIFELSASDFMQDENAEDHEHACQPLFYYTTGLACIAENMCRTFYTIKASQRLSDDFRSSIDAARPIRAQLQQCHLPSNRVEGAGDLHFSYLVLEMFLYRAILRPLARSPPPPPISDDNDPTPMGSLWPVEDLTSDRHVFDQLPAMNSMQLGEAEEATLKAAEKCAAIILNFVGALVPHEFGSFWHPFYLPGNRTCFAAVSNFVTLLLVQAPTRQHALRSRDLLDLWSHTLRCQHRSHEGLMQLGLVRLNQMQIEGLDNIFNLPAHVSEILQNTAE
ncbi:Transcription factor, fungi [Penicillium expansum]|uniref:Transcription factor, fungi n=1 Tax=Penicillium expansum TaxID=27334 RepID=A0A0A2JYI4_PENEN|nr:Transcription factor, fungi [Penicillium expansum]KGO48660.1 Transcription factor, fungi [Penicillium expansum]KGO57225.1 Transcription factor, fungi [Penicillium expansum]KGO68636.1 Transcription factor, fungi [Penicillium expansum]